MNLLSAWLPATAPATAAASESSNKSDPKVAKVAKVAVLAPAITPTRSVAAEAAAAAAGTQSLLTISEGSIGAEADQSEISEEKAVNDSYFATSMKYLSNTGTFISEMIVGIWNAFLGMFGFGASKNDSKDNKSSQDKPDHDTASLDLSPPSAEVGCFEYK